MNYVNYHSHKMFTNKIVADSPVYYEDYISRALELGQSVITSVEHGYQGNYFQLNELIQKKNIELQKRRDDGEKDVPRNLKFVFGTEAYWVKDRHEKDKSNCHMVILAKTEKGRKAINLMLSKANEDGVFNGRPRIDFDLLFKLPKDDVFITTACLAYWNKYDNIEEITLKFKRYFQENFYLEVQNHNTDQQKKLNQNILSLSEKHNIKIIAGMDSHYIYKEDAKKRDDILHYKHIYYDDEEGWFMDYPSYEEAIKRFKEQGILSDKQIDEAMHNTNIIESFENIDLGLKIVKDDDGDYEVYSDYKLPTMYPSLSQHEKDKILKDSINKEWKIFKEKEKILKQDEQKYLDGIRYEVGEVIKTGMSDYFLLHYEGLKIGKEKYGGKITKRGRGSAVGFFMNTLLGFSKVDRFKAPIKLYPERFLTSDRILKTRAMPDIDNNIDRQEPFVQGFKDLLGEHGIYPMIAFGTLKKSSAIKLYMGANDEPATIQDEISKQLQTYDEKIKYCETEEDKEEINIEDYISKEYLHYVDESKSYQGIVVQASPHPCAFLLLNGDIREEIGIIRCESKASKKSSLVACIDGTTADHYKFLKTDLLIVDVVGLTEAIWERIGEESISNSELERRLSCSEGNKAWDMYKKGYTLCINQCEKDGTRKKCMKYKMKDTASLSAFVAGIRPGFKSLINNFLDRKPYTTGVEALDEILKDSYHYMLYQESIMAFLNWLGIDMKETYEIVKKISKKIFLKHPEQMEELKNKVKPQWIKNTGSEDKFDTIFQIVNDAGSYAFNSAHSYCVGNDGAEIAYLKAYYPYETYETCLNWFDKKKNKDKVALLKKEMKDGFEISVGELKWGNDNRQFTLDKKNKCIHPCLSSIKNMGKNVADELWNLYSENNKYDTFIDLLNDLQNTSITTTMIQTLIKLNYFSPFGKSKKLLRTYNTYEQFHKKKQFKKDQLEEDSINIIRKFANKETEKILKDVDIMALMNHIIDKIPNEQLPLQDMISTELESLGYISYNNNKLNKRYVLITDINTKYTPVIDTYCLNNGMTCKCKIPKKIWNNIGELKQNDIIYIHSMEKKFGWKKVGEKEDKKTGKLKPIFEQDESKLEWHITNYSIIPNMEEILDEIQ